MKVSNLAYSFIIGVGLMISNSLIVNAQKYAGTPARKTPEWFRKGLSYQIQLRAFTDEGTLRSAEAKFDHLKEIGVSTIYLWPVFVADDDTCRANWSPRQIASGFNNPKNPYRMKDYYHVDPEYGGDEALRHFVDAAHAKGLRVLLDLVYCHCGPKAVCVEQHPEFFKYDSEGRMELTRWNFPQFDFNSKPLRLYFKTNMMYWLCDYGVDGFRCDVADLIPIDFWEEIRAEMEVFNPDAVLIAEGDHPDNTHYAFNANYNWPVFQLAVLELLSKPEEYADRGGAAFIRACHEGFRARCPEGALGWNMIENHDWSSDDYHNRAEKRLGHENRELGLAMCFALDGVPLIYNGQEVCDTCRHSLWSTPGACTIDWAQGESPEGQRRMSLIKDWMRLRSDFSPAMHYGSTVWLDNNRPESVCSFLRRACVSSADSTDGSSDGSTDEVCGDVLFVGNFSASPVKVSLSTGAKLKLPPYGYYFGPASKLK